MQAQHIENEDEFYIKEGAFCGFCEEDLKEVYYTIEEEGLVEEHARESEVTLH